MLELQQGSNPSWTVIFVLTPAQTNTQISSSQKLLVSCSKNFHPRSSLHVRYERNQSIPPATKEGSPSCLEQGHVSQLQRGSAAATSLWNHRSDDGTRPPDSTGNGDSGGWRMSLVKYGLVRGERGWALWRRAVTPRGWLHHWRSLRSQWGVGGREEDFCKDPIKAVSLSSFYKISSFVPIAWDYKHEYPNFNFYLSRKESLNENLLPCCCNGVDSQGSICILLEIDEWVKWGK